MEKDKKNNTLLMSNEERDKVINWLSELMTLPKSAHAL